MEYSVYMQHPEGSNVPQVGVPWKLIGTFESERDLRHVSLAYALEKVNKNRQEGEWYQTLPVEISGKKPEIRY